MEETHRSTQDPGTDWAAIAASDAFRDLEARKRHVMLGLLAVYVVAVGTFLVLCAYARHFMGSSVDSGLTVAYVWLLALTVLAWVEAFTYLRIAQRVFEPAAQALAQRVRNGELS